MIKYTSQSKTLIRRLFVHWHDNLVLASSELAMTHPAIHGEAQNDTRRAMDVRSLLLTALERLKPTSRLQDPLKTMDDPQWKDPLWTSYAIIYGTYLHEQARVLSVPRLNSLFALARSTYYLKLDEAFERLSNILDEIGEEMTSAADRINLLLAIPPAPPLHFYGRDALLAELRDQLNRAALSSKDKVVALWGAAGIGKSSVLQTLAHDITVKTMFPDGVLWAEAGVNNTDLLSRLLAWAKAVGIPDSALTNKASVQAIKAAIYQATGARRILLIVDDVWPDTELDIFLTLGQNCALIFSTRTAEVARRYSPTLSIMLEPLAAESALELLRRKAPTAVEAVPDQAEALVKRLAGWPQAIVLAGQQLLTASHSGQLRRIRQKYADLMAAQGIDVLAAVIGSSIELLPTPARQLLETLSIFPPKPITFAESAAIEVSGAEHNVLDILVDAGLVEAVGAQNIDHKFSSGKDASEDRYTIHQSIREYAYALLTASGHQMDATRQYIAHFAYTAQRYASDYSQLRVEMDHILNALMLAVSAGFDDFQARIAVSIASFLQSRGQRNEAITMLEQAHHSAVLVNNEALRAEAACELCQIAYTQQDWDEAEKWGREVEAFGSDTDRALPTALEILAQVMLRRGDQAAATAYARRGLAAAQKSQVPTVIDRLLLVLNQLTSEDIAPVVAESNDTDGTLRAMQHWRQAAQHYVQEANLEATFDELEKALAAAKDANDLDYTVNSLGFLTLVANSLGDYDRAMLTCQAAQRLPLDTKLGRGYALCFGFGAMSYLHRGNETAARQWLDFGMNAASHLQSQEGLCWMHFAFTNYWLHRKEVQTANEHAQAALSCAQRMHAHDSTSRMLALCGRMAAVLGRFDEAEQYLHDAHARAFDGFQPYYAEDDMGYLAFRRGDFETAAGHFRTVFAFFNERKFRSRIPSVGANLMRTLVHINERDEAVMVGRLVVSTCQQIGHVALGATHALMQELNLT